MSVSKPNVIYLHSHDTGRYIQPYGYSVSTPNLQRFAEQGVLFRHAFCAGPTCSPSRAALLTGQYPHQVGMYGLAHRGWSLNDYSSTVITSLKAAGYHTVLGGFQHIVNWAENDWKTIGYDERLINDSGESRARTACEFLQRDHNRPFFLDVGFTETHRTKRIEHEGRPVAWHNHAESPIGDPRYVQPPITLPDNPVTRQDFADFAYSATRLDRHYGMILDQLDASNLTSNTIVIITTDHGIAFPRMKCNLTDHGLGVLLLMRGPESLMLSEGQVIDAMVSHLDIVPTLCDWLSLDAPGTLQGKSLSPLLSGKLTPSELEALHKCIYAEVNYHGKRQIERAIRTPRYKYIRCYDPQPFEEHSCDASTSKNLISDYGLGGCSGDHEQLYDLVYDRAEFHNLAGQQTYQEIVNQLRSELETWMRQTNDPTLCGNIPLNL